MYWTKMSLHFHFNLLWDSSCQYVVLALQGKHRRSCFVSSGSSIVNQYNLSLSNFLSLIFVCLQYALKQAHLSLHFKVKTIKINARYKSIFESLMQDIENLSFSLSLYLSLSLCMCVFRCSE